MPLYEFRCPQCGVRFERLTSFNMAQRPQVCPICGSQEAKKIFSTFATNDKQGASSSASADCAPSGG